MPEYSQRASSSFERFDLVLLDNRYNALDTIHLLRLGSTAEVKIDSMAYDMLSV